MRFLWVTAFALVVDQISKWVVVKYMYQGQSIPLIGDWLRFTYTTNPGMAFGIAFGPPGLVTVLSLLATGLIVAYMISVRDGYRPYVVSLALILGGALGNIIDRMFYGIIYNHGGIFTGEVVDFIHVNVWRGYVPPDVPWLGGKYLALFPIWNVADMAIVAGVVGILIFQNKFHELRMPHEATPSAGSDGTALEGRPVVAGTAATAAPETPGQTLAPAAPVGAQPAVAVYTDAPAERDEPLPRRDGEP